MYRLDVGEIQSTIKVIRSLLPFCVKKHADLQIALDYFDDRITGNKAIMLLDNLRAIGSRRGAVHVADLPFTRSEGLRLYKLTNAKKARDAHIVKVPREIRKQIKADHSKEKLSHVTLSKKYCYSVSVIRRVLGTR